VHSQKYKTGGCKKNFNKTPCAIKLIVHNIMISAYNQNHKLF